MNSNTGTKSYARALTIAGSDPSGGAGLQADLKTFSALGVFGTTAIVAVVDENTQGVYGVHPIPDDFVAGQIRSVLDDIGTDAIKIGMLHSAPLIRTVLATLRSYPDVRNIVLDPVMVATSGDPLLQPEAIGTLRDELIPYCRVITPNLPEAAMLLGHEISRPEDMPDAARDLSALYPGEKVSVMLKAGHFGLEAEAGERELKAGDTLTDVFYNAESGRVSQLSSPLIDTRNTHGTGCTLSSAIAAHLALGYGLDEAVAKGKNYLAEALTAGAPYAIGRGHGPVNHFYALWK